MVAAARSPAEVIGREVELGHLATLLAGAVAGVPSMCVVDGEAGIGKTTLVRDACDRFAGEILWGTCAHFGAGTVPFGAVASALDGYISRAAEGVRGQVLQGLGDLDALLPSAPEVMEPHPGILLQQFDRAIRRIAHLSPCVLVIDDLQWADQSSLDLLAFLATGFLDQRLAILVTVRDEDRFEGHVLNGWLADLRRLPGISECHLSRLDLAATAQQIAALTKEPVAPGGFAAQAFGRSGGNPYLTELLVQADDPKLAALSASVPDTLRQVLLSRWHGLSLQAREVSRLLALSGRPVERAVLAAVAGQMNDEWETGPNLSAGLAEAISAGVVQPVGAHLWFRHPLIAEVLVDDLGAHDATASHAAYAAVLAGLGDARRGDVAVHHELAGNAPEALAWSLAAADSATSVQGAPEHLDHLRRACRLWPRVMVGTDTNVDEHIKLLLRTVRAACGVARPEEALALIDEALSLTDTASRPHMVCRLLVLQHQLLTETQRLSFDEVTDSLQQAANIAASLPGTAERAIVDAALAWTEAWSAGGGPRFRSVAAAALATARATGSPDALMPALVIAATSCPESDEAVVWLQEAYTLAERCGDAMEMLDASVGLNNLHQARGEYAAIVDTAAERGRKLIQAGAPSAGQFLLTAAGGFALTLGRWADAEDHVRPALACAEGGHREASARSVMAVLCARRGDLHQGEQHLARAAEVAATHYMGTGTYPFGRAELALAQNRPDQALEVITQEMPAAARGDPRDADELLLLAARAAADLAQDARDQRLTHGTQRAEALFDRVLTERTSRTTEVFIAWSPQDHIQIARSALYNAELARLRNDPDLSLAWAAATQLCHTAGLLWEEAAAACHQARATLAEGLPRHQAATALRHGSSIAAHLGARPLLLELQGTAAAAHISLDEVAPPSALRISEAGGGHTVFTPREQEVLAYVVAGRSNTEIARELFISDKTVSVHISNILRKTGAQTRVQAAAWASRQNHPPSHVRNEDI